MFAYKWKKNHLRSRLFFIGPMTYNLPVTYREDTVEKCCNVSRKCALLLFLLPSLSVRDSVRMVVNMVCAGSKQGTELAIRAKTNDPKSTTSFYLFPSNAKSHRLSDCPTFSFFFSIVPIAEAVYTISFCTCSSWSHFFSFYKFDKWNVEN